MGLTSLSPMITMTITTEITEMEYRNFNTGDQIWVRHNEGVFKFITHDGLYWEEGMPNMVRLTGLNKLINTVAAFLIRLSHKI